MTRRTPLEELERAKTNREVEAALDHAPHLISKRSTGRHTVWVGPTGSVPAPVSHPGECNRWTKNSIIRMAVAAGLFGIIILLMLLPVFRVA